MPVFEDPYTPGRYYYECEDCGERTTSEQRQFRCESCGGPLRNIAVPRE